MARSSFKFRLQRLLDVRVMREKIAQGELQVRRQQVVNEQQKLVRLQQEEVQLREDQRQPLERGGDLHEFEMKRHFLELAIKAKGQEQVQQQGRIAEAERAVVQQQEVVKQAGIDVKALEKVKENQREEHRLDQLREEGLFMDDLAGQGFLRRRKHGEIVAAEEAARAAANTDGMHS